MAVTASQDQLTRALGALIETSGVEGVLTAALHAHDHTCRPCQRAEARCETGQRLADATAARTTLPGYQPI